MPIFEIEIPGSLVEPYEEKLDLMLKKLERVFYEANAALILFNNAKPPKPDSSSFHESVMAMSQRTSEIQSALYPEAPAPRDLKAIREMHARVNLEYQREQWAAGILPMAISMQIRPILARAFLYAFDTFDRCLADLSNYPNVPEGLRAISAEFRVKFPDLREVRNSAHHQEDRAVGMIDKKNPLIPLPIDNGAIRSHGEARVSANLIGNVYGETMRDGNLGSMDVSEESMHKLRDTLSAVLKSFDWLGPTQRRPF